ncbi:Hypothetical protein, putative [Bodo saltans]|uniref:WD40 repeat-containing protein n=1 Tax=Bodo saltans TaxID=75058 RepID=A0A0S4KHS2_BODSA|nr:Hypothetical protein, putative [Bodo saltans]|eukprot:CUI12947.1 Hypothetical protein, putative [Bodo saltans]
MNSEFQHERHHQLRSRSPRLVNVVSSGSSAFGGSSLVERCSRSGGGDPTLLHHLNAASLSRRGSHIVGGGDGMMSTTEQPTRLRSPVVMLEDGGESLPLRTLLPSATFLSAGGSGASVPPPPPPPSINTDNPSYRSIYASRCAASLGDSPNAIDPRHRGMSSSGNTIPPTSMNHHYVSAAEGMHGGASHASTSATATSIIPQRSSSSMGSAHYQHPRQGPQQQQQRWHASMEHNPIKVLGAPGLVDDAYSQCMSWGSERLAGLLNDQFLLFDVSRPTEVCAAYKLGTPDGSYGHSTTTVTESAASRFSCVAMRPYQDSECLVGDTRGILRFLKCHEGSTAVVVDRQVSLAEATGVQGELMLSNEQQHLRLGCGPHPTTRQPSSSLLIRMQAASMASNMSLLFDLSYRSVSCAEGSDHHPQLFLAGTASGVVALVDSRIQGLGAVVAQARIALPPTSTFSSTSPCPGVIGDRVLGISWNSSGSLFAVGSNTTGVSVWSLAKMSEPMTTISVGKQQTSSASALSPARRAAVLRGASPTPSAQFNSVSAAVRGIQFSPVDPFELAYGGGVGDGVISVVNVLHAGGRKLFSAATGAQVSQVRYSPCGSMLITSHGLRSQDIPAPPTATTAGQQQHDQLTSTAYDWGGAPDGPCSRRKYCIAVWSRGKTSRTPSLAFLGGGGAPGGNNTLSSTSTSGNRTSNNNGNIGLNSHRRSASRDSLDPSDDDDTGTSSAMMSDVDSMASEDDLEDYDSIAGDHHRHRASPMSASSPTSGKRSSARPLQLKIRLDGHTARPLHMCVPRQNSPYGPYHRWRRPPPLLSWIRFWNAFQQQRRVTTRQSAATVAATTSSRQTSPRSEVAPSVFPSAAEPRANCWGNAASDDHDAFGSLR